jgi:CRISPR-associated protein Cas6
MTQIDILIFKRKVCFMNKNYVEICFNVLGNTIPADYAYWLFSAISKILPEVHNDNEIAICEITGKVVNTTRKLHVTDTSMLIIRTPLEKVTIFQKLVGKCLHINEDCLFIPSYFVRELPSFCNTSYSNLVILRGYTSEEGFIKKFREILHNKDLEGEASLIPVKFLPHQKLAGTKSKFIRRTVCVAKINLVGYAIEITNLTEKSSQYLKEKGIGIGRHVGCGIFY